MKRNSSLIVILASLLAFSGMACVERSGSLFQTQMPWTGDSFVFAAIQTPSGNGKVVCFQAHLTNMLLEEKSVTTVGESPRAIQIYDTAVYVANATSGSLLVFRWDQRTCGLTLLQSFSGLTGLTSLAMSYAKAKLYAGYASGVQRYDVAEDGTLTTVGAPASAGGAILGLALAPNGVALYANRTGNVVYNFPINTDGSLGGNGSIGYTTITAMKTGVSVTTSEHYLFVADSTTDSVDTYLIDQSDGSLSFVGAFSVTDPKEINYYAYQPALYVLSDTGILRTYNQAADGTFTLYDTNSEVSDTVVSTSTQQNPNLKYFSVGTTGGIYSWMPVNTGSGMALKVVRTTSVTPYGSYANSLTGVVVSSY